MFEKRHYPQNKKLHCFKVNPKGIPVLTNSAKTKRLEYCKNHKFDKFTNVIFADEAIM